MTEIIIVDDHKLVARGILSMLKPYDELKVVSMFYNGTDLMMALTKKRPDILILDINLPDINGVDICRMVNKKYPEMKVIVLTTYNDANYIKVMLKNGARSYLLKNTGQSELVLAINKVMEGELYLPEVIKGQLSSEDIDGNMEGNFPKLTRKEFDILDALTENYSVIDLSISLSLSTKMVELLIGNLFLKFDVTNVTQLLMKNEMINSH